MRLGNLLAAGLAVGIVALVASTRRMEEPAPPDPRPPPPPDPTPPPVRQERAVTVSDADLKEQPDAGARTVRRLPRGTVAVIEPSASPGWVYAIVLLPLPSVEGYLRVADLSYTGI